ncbi:respiratory nitrate reductase chaperone NarJ [Hydrogenobacter hydrogenophilus]|uniref:Respiratory nitrate reductase chaperone NarJ n=2 Tax=Hydrogenobacter hydrogenophilus TaxID=35835 RepID=A0A285NWU4_9AQUI|nr:respiratory nitrate reductase chaperone NarJ [Hydrogenobacter hydrogenophilus]
MSVLHRAYIYQFLSLAFFYPQKELLEELEEGLHDLSLSFKTLQMQVDLEPFKKAIAEAKERVIDLQGEWNALFSTTLKAPANETAYELEKAGRKAVELADIEGFYKAFGLEVKSPYEPDSIVAELEFTAFLLRGKMWAEQQGNAEAQEVYENAFRSFFRDHLGRWYRIFTDLLKEHSEENYYRHLGELLKSFLDKEREGIEGIVDLKEYRKEVLEGVSWKCGT